MSGGVERMLGYDKEGRTLNTRGNVYPQMMIEICSHYRSLPDVRTLTYNEIEFFYNAIKPTLKQLSKQAG